MQHIWQTTTISYTSENPLIESCTTIIDSNFFLIDTPPHLLKWISNFQTDRSMKITINEKTLPELRRRTAKQPG